MTLRKRCTYDTSAVSAGLIASVDAETSPHVTMILYYCRRNYDRDDCKSLPDLDGPKLIKMNDLSPTEKLEHALDMAEALAMMHNHKDGLIVHGTLQVAQRGFLLVL